MDKPALLHMYVKQAPPSPRPVQTAQQGCCAHLHNLSPTHLLHDTKELHHPHEQQASVGKPFWAAGGFGA